MQDGPTRKIIKFAARMVWTINLKATRLLWRAQGRRPYRLAGKCRCCAACCETPAIQVSPFTYRLPTLRRAFLAWQYRVNGFEFQSADPRSHTFVFTCSHFDPQTRRCDSYSSRPGMCRDYPRLLLWEPDAPFLPGCAYRAVSRKAARVEALLAEEDIPPEKLQQVRRALHLEAPDDPPAPEEESSR